MTLNNFLAAWITALIFIASTTKPVLEYLEARENNATIAYAECVRNDIKANNLCYERFIK